jgi:lysozyme
MDAADVAELTAQLCRRYEGFRAAPYLCPAGVPTIGYGATRYENGLPVRLGDPSISQEIGERMLLDQLNKIYVPGTRHLCPSLDGAALAAISDFSFNLGLTRLKGSTLRKRLLEGDLEAAATELRKWVRGGGRVLPGLVARREAEAALLTGGQSDG